MAGLVADAPPGVRADRQEEVGERVRPVRERHRDGRDGAVDGDGVEAPGAGRLVGRRTAWEEDAVLVSLHDRVLTGDLDVADLPGKPALVATGHAIALVPGVLRRALRADVTTVRHAGPPTRGIHALTPRRDPHPCTAPLLDRLTAALLTAP